MLANGAGGGELFTAQSTASAAAAAASDRPRRDIRPPPRMHAQFLDEHQVWFLLKCVACTGSR